MKKIKLLVIALFLFVSMASAQWTYTNGYYNSSVAYGVKVTYDSLVTSYTSDWIDWTLINNQTVYANISFVQAYFDHGAGNDTVRCILQCKDLWGGIVNIDTIGTEGGAGSEKIISNTTLSAALYQDTVTMKYVYPMIRFYLYKLHTGGGTIGDNGVFYCDLYARITTPVYSGYTRIPWK